MLIVLARTVCLYNHYAHNYSTKANNIEATGSENSKFLTLSVLV